MQPAIHLHIDSVVVDSALLEPRHTRVFEIALVREISLGLASGPPPAARAQKSMVAPPLQNAGPFQPAVLAAQVARSVVRTLQSPPQNHSRT